MLFSNCCFCLPLSHTPAASAAHSCWSHSTLSELYCGGCVWCFHPLFVRVDHLTEQADVVPSQRQPSADSPFSHLLRFAAFIHALRSSAAATSQPPNTSIVCHLLRLPLLLSSLLHRPLSIVRSLRPPTTASLPGIPLLLCLCHVIVISSSSAIRCGRCHLGRAGQPAARCQGARAGSWAGRG